jgi:signal transduction histidine kinase
MNYLEKISLENSIDFKNIVDSYKQPAIICRSSDKIPSLLYIIVANQKFCTAFKVSNKSVVNKSYDFFYENIDFDEFPEERIEYSKLLSSIQERKKCEITLHLPNYNRYHKNKINIQYLPGLAENNFKLDNYHIFLYNKISVSKTDTKTNPKANVALLRSLERTLRVEMLLRDVSNLIISNTTIHLLAQKLSLILLNYFKCDRCLIYDYENNKQNFFIETCADETKPIYSKKNYFNSLKAIKRLIKFQNDFYYRFGLKEAKKSFVFAIQNIREDSNFSDMEDFFDEYKINSQIVVNIIFNGTIIGGICIHQSLSRHWLNEEIEFLEIIAEQFSIAIDRFYSIKKLTISNVSLLDTKNKLENSLAYEKEMRKIQNEFIALVSHEFKTPLQVIDSARELIVRKIKTITTDSSLLNYCSKIHSGIQRVNSLISSTLNLARIESNKGQIKPEIINFDIQKMILDIIEKNINFAMQKNVNIVNNIAKLSPDFCSDPKMLDHVINNIVVNAIKYSHRDSVIKINAKKFANYILLSIIDNGIGVPRQDLKNIGNKFFRAANTISVAGTGIGIYISRYFIDLLDGKISIKSQEGIGTRVAILFKDNKNK